MTSLTPDAQEQQLESFMRFARYCNGLTPTKLKEPYDPIVVGAIEDFEKQQRQLLLDKLEEKMLEVIKVPACNCKHARYIVAEQRIKLTALLAELREETK